MMKKVIRLISLSFIIASPMLFASSCSKKETSTKKNGVVVSSIEELEDLKMQLIKEKEEQIKEVEQEINKRKSMGLKGNKNEQ